MRFPGINIKFKKKETLKKLKVVENDDLHAENARIFEYHVSIVDNLI